MLEGSCALAQLPFLSAAEKPAGQIPNLGPKEECGTNTSTRPQADFVAERVGVVKENKVNAAALRIGKVAGA